MRSKNDFKKHALIVNYISKHNNAVTIDDLINEFGNKRVTIIKTVNTMERNNLVVVCKNIVALTERTRMLCSVFGESLTCFGNSLIANITDSEIVSFEKQKRLKSKLNSY